MLQFGEKVKKKREQTNLNQQDLASFVGCSRATISQIEGEQQNPSFFVRVKIARILGIDLNKIDLWDEEIDSQEGVLANWNEKYNK